MNEKPTHLDLFSGIGGFALAAKWAGFETIGFCEIDKYCQKVLQKNFLADAESGRDKRSDEQAGIFLRIAQCRPRLFSDVRNLDGTQFRRNGCNVTLLTGGFPCQPFSCAGKRRGAKDDRHLWPEMLRVIKEARPAWVLGENVAGIIGMELDAVLSDLEAAGYSTRPFVIPACGVDARHRRNRVWIVANLSESRLERAARSGLQGRSEGFTAGCEDVANRDEPGSQGRNGAKLRERSDEWIAGTGDSHLSDADEGRFTRRSEQDGGRSAVGRAERACGWQLEPDMGRVAHGIPARVDRLKGLGNAIVPQVAYQIMRAIREQIEQI